VIYGYAGPTRCWAAKARHARRRRRLDTIDGGTGDDRIYSGLAPPSSPSTDVLTGGNGDDLLISDEGRTAPP
jgi:Ca2+-binding RTX toxin-like protein